MASNQVENLLQAWLNMEMSIRGNRVLSEMSFNEMIICHILLRARDAGQNVTATDLCDRMHLLKSQMNGMVTSLEGRGIVTRVPSSSDRRKSYVVITDAGQQIYESEHAGIVHIMSNILSEISEEDAERCANVMQTATRIYQKTTKDMV